MRGFRCLFAVPFLCAFHAPGGASSPATAPLSWEVDTSAIKRDCLVREYDRLVRCMRPVSTPGHVPTDAEKRQWREYCDSRIGEGGTDWACLRSSALAALDEKPVNWDMYRAAVLVAGAVAYNEEYEKSGMVEPARRALTAARGEKMSDAQGRALLDTMTMLGKCYGEASARLLRECVRLEFWGDAPMRSLVTGTETEQSLTMLRTRAVHELQNLRDKGLPFLMELQKEYPDTSPVRKPRSEYRFEDGIGLIIKNAIDEIRSRVTM